MNRTQKDKKKEDNREFGFIAFICTLTGAEWNRCLPQKISFSKNMQHPSSIQLIKMRNINSGMGMLYRYLHCVNAPRLRWIKCQTQASGNFESDKVQTPCSTGDFGFAEKGIIAPLTTVWLLISGHWLLGFNLFSFRFQTRRIIWRVTFFCRSMM